MSPEKKLERLKEKREKLLKELYKVNLKIHFYNEYDEQMPPLSKKKRKKK